MPTEKDDNVYFNVWFRNYHLKTRDRCQAYPNERVKSQSWTKNKVLIKQKWTNIKWGQRTRLEILPTHVFYNLNKDR